MLSNRRKTGLGFGVLAAFISLPMVCMASDIEYVSNENLPALGPYVPATVFGELVFTSGQIALDAEEGKITGTDIREQTRKTLENLRAVLEAAGSSLNHTLRITVYLQNPGDFAAMNEVYAEFFPENEPARTTVPGVDWGGTVLVEIDAIAVRAQNRAD